MSFFTKLTLITLEMEKYCFCKELFVVINIDHVVRKMCPIHRQSGHLIFDISNFQMLRILKFNSMFLIDIEI